ncbi:MAG: acyl-CoA thioesterase [Oscillospiraceae bacterium]|jgi:acyl-CoA hydrolase|nr:acyl-CoA thioesterase [Oscillospiraceae bacterium]MBQ8930740.1 acyl-CoA thioesterase [Oscillospiraceae bacterium]MBR6429917.1 acyl-CoA thioesterase [Oscillospiraceae bacterium]
MASITTSVQIVLPQHCNGNVTPRLFGGQLMAWIDIVGAVAARRYAHSTVTTVCVDNLHFVSPAYLNDTVVQEAVVTWTGSTSLEVRVDSFVEQLGGERKMVNRAYLVFVALGEDNKPVPVAPFVPQTPAEQAEYEAAIARREVRLRRK